jgi:hypothetical protein
MNYVLKEARMQTKSYIRFLFFLFLMAFIAGPGNTNNNRKQDLGNQKENIQVIPGFNTLQLTNGMRLSLYERCDLRDGTQECSVVIVLDQNRPNPTGWVLKGNWDINVSKVLLATIDAEQELARLNPDAIQEQDYGLTQPLNLLVRDILANIVGNNANSILQPNEIIYNNFNNQEFQLVVTLIVEALNNELNNELPTHEGGFTWPFNFPDWTSQPHNIPKIVALDIAIVVTGTLCIICEIIDRIKEKHPSLSAVVTRLEDFKSNLKNLSHISLITPPPPPCCEGVPWDKIGKNSFCEMATAFQSEKQQLKSKPIIY